MKRLLLLILAASSLSAQIKVNEQVLEQLVNLIESDRATQSLIISNNEKIIHEFYGTNYDEDDLATSWSIAKTFYAALIGVAIQKDLIVYDFYWGIK
jgi:hypothetical protein